MTRIDNSKNMTSALSHINIALTSYLQRYNILNRNVNAEIISLLSILFFQSKTHFHIALDKINN